MPKTIHQKIIFKNTSPKDLYELYMDSKKHSAATGAPAKLSSKEGGVYAVHDGYIGGKNLQLIKNRLIVQSWRTIEWNDGDIDSTFIIYLEPKKKDVVLYMEHVNVPDKHAESINKGWHQHYWEPWKKYLAGNPVAESIKM